MQGPSIVKMLGGILLIIIGIWFLSPLTWPLGLNLWRYLWDLILGFVPIFLVLIGVLIVWIESEEMKFQKPKKK